MPDRTNTRVPQRDDGPSNQCSEKAASDKIAYEVIIGAQQPNKRYRDTNRIYGPEPRVADPIHRHDRANSHHVTGWESGEARTPVKWVKIVDAIADERRIILHPCVGPRAAEGELEPIFRHIRNSPAQCSDKTNGLNFGHALPDDHPDSNQESAGNNKRAENLWQASGHIEDGAISFQLGVNKKGNRPVNPKK